MIDQCLAHTYIALANLKKESLKFRTIINLRNRNGNTAMELATLYWPQSVVDCILALGAKAGFGEKTSSGFDLEKSIDKILHATL